MISRFWPAFFISISVCFILVFLAGFSLTIFREAQLKQSLLKKSVQLDGLLSLKKLNKKLDFLIKETQQGQDQEKISSESPFFALVFVNQSQVEKIYIAEDASRLSIKSQEENQPAVLQKNESPFHTPLEKRKILIELSRMASSQPISDGFQFKILHSAGKKQPFILFIAPLDENKQWLAFLKENKDFFKLLTFASKGKKDKNREVFSVNSQGRIIFHNKNSKIFKFLSKKSSIWKTLKKLDKEQFSGGKYLKLQKKTGYKEMYYFQKWDEGDMFLIAKTDLPPPVFFLPFLSLKDSYFIGWITGFAIFCLFFVFFCFRLVSLVSAYQFLKRAFMSFGKTGWFPSVDTLRNPLLYFYDNRRLFFDKTKNEDQDNEETKSRSANFQEIIKQELEKLKSKFPRLIVKKEFDFDVRVFGFERFLRVIVHELLWNALEAMGGLKEPKLDISVKKEGDLLVFSLRDYGTGIHEKDYKKLFRLYYSTKSQLGLGLNLVQSIVQSNEGDIELSSPKEGGLKVCIRLPLKCFLKNHESG